MILNVYPVGDIITQKENIPSSFKTEKLDCVSLGG